jgi:hypothetical protein
MPARKTESRIPANFQAADLGEAVVAPDGRCALVSFITSPLAVNRENTYIVFVTDAAVSTEAESFEWMFTENAGAPSTQTTQFGEIAYQPQFEVLTGMILTGRHSSASVQKGRST